MEYLNAVHELLGVEDRGLVVEAGHQPILKEDHPHLLPVGVVHGGVEGDELEVWLKGQQLPVHTAVKHGHVIVGEVRGDGRDPVNPRIQLVVDKVVPRGLGVDVQLVLGVDDAHQDRGSDLNEDELQQGLLTPHYEVVGLVPVRELVGLQPGVAWVVVRNRPALLHLHV